MLCLALLLPRCQEDRTESEAGAGLDPTPTLVLETTKGRIVIEMDREKAPLTVANIVRHVEIGFYDSLTFYRVKSGFMIQAGSFTADLRRRSSSAKPILNEADNGLSNRRGTVAMARTEYIHSAETDFFINLVDNYKLDYGVYPDGWGYAVFGRVIEGMDVVDAIAAVPVRPRRPTFEALPVEPIVITRAYLIDEEPAS
ncbi:MAG: peptidylprolyl isomerase [Gemmatimonadota bacterium]|nr:MAG: peptidylprolyl isomerase [Gemmatimonadota bacterium]